MTSRPYNINQDQTDLHIAILTRVVYHPFHAQPLSWLTEKYPSSTAHPLFYNLTCLDFQPFLPLHSQQARNISFISPQHPLSSAFPSHYIHYPPNKPLSSLLPPLYPQQNPAEPLSTKQRNKTTDPLPLSPPILLTRALSPQSPPFHSPISVQTPPLSLPTNTIVPSKSTPPSPNQHHRT